MVISEASLTQRSQEQELFIYQGLKEWLEHGQWDSPTVSREAELDDLDPCLVEGHA